MLSRREWCKERKQWIDTGKFWNKSKKRFLISFLIVNVIPSLYFALILLPLGSVQLELSISPANIVWLLLIPLLASVPFGFYRIYAAVLLYFDGKIVDKTPQYEWYLEGRDSASPLRHLLGSLFYFIWPVLFWLWYLTAIVDP